MQAHTLADMPKQNSIVDGKPGMHYVCKQVLCSQIQASLTQIKSCLVAGASAYKSVCKSVCPKDELSDDNNHP